MYHIIALCIAFQKILPLHNINGHLQNTTCISTWYCCGKAKKYIQDTNYNHKGYQVSIHLNKNLFYNYMNTIAKELTQIYREISYGKFLDIGGTGNKKSMMDNVYDKFKHFAGPLDYWLVDIDESVSTLQNGIMCDIENCSKISDESFDVTFSHTVLEHVKRPERAFDTIARITKKNGLSIHVLPWTYHFHAVPFDMYRFSHQALTTIFEDRGFTIIHSGYDICEKIKNIRNEYYPVIWLSFVIAKKM